MSDSGFDKPLPHSLEAERAVLGALLIANDSINAAIELVRSDDFFQTAHAIIFATMLELYEEEQKFDLITLSERLKQKKRLKDVGGAGYLASLLESVPTAVNVTHHAQIVAQKSLNRQLLSIGNKVVHECIDDGEPIAEILDRVERDIFVLGERRFGSNVVHIGEILKESFERIGQLFQQKQMITGVPSGFKDLDQLTSGFQPSDLIIIAARPSVGKTSFLLNIAEYASVHEKMPSLLFSLEMSKEAIANRLLCAIARIDSQKMRTGFLSQKDFNDLRGAADQLYKSPIYIDDTPGMNVLEIRAKARRMKNQHDIRIIFVDYLQLLRAVGRIDSRQQEISQISGALKDLAKELRIPVVVCSQLSRDIEKRKEKEPKLSDLRESGSIEQDGDVIGFLHKPDAEDDLSLEGQSSIVEFVLGKQRNGPTGSFKMVFLKRFTRFQNMSRSQQVTQQVPPEAQETDESEVPF